MNQIPGWKVEVATYSTQLSKVGYEGVFVEKLDAQMSLLFRNIQ